MKLMISWLIEEPLHGKRSCYLKFHNNFYQVSLVCLFPISIWYHFNGTHIYLYLYTLLLILRQFQLLQYLSPILKTILWSALASGSYIFKKGFHLLTRSYGSNFSNPFWKLLWSIKVPMKNLFSFGNKFTNQNFNVVIYQSNNIYH